MALFPKCQFELILPREGLAPGTRVEGELVLTVPEAIPRAQEIRFSFESRALAAFGSGKSRRSYAETIFSMPMKVSLPRDVPLAQGIHRHTFAVDIPSSMPSNFKGPDCSIEHRIETRVDVDWAVDPKKTFEPLIVPKPQQAVQVPRLARSPTSFHESIVLELAIDSTTIVAGAPLSGRIALRGGHQARFDALILSLVSVTTIRMTEYDVRNEAVATVSIPAAALRTGESVPFQLETNPSLPAFRDLYIDNAFVLNVRADVPWTTDPSFDIPLEVLPRGSVVHGEGALLPIGDARLRSIAASMAEATGLRIAREPTLVEGAVEMITLDIADGPRNGLLGVDIAIGFPDLGLGIEFRPLGFFQGFSESPLLPKTLANQFHLRIKPSEGKPAASDEALSLFIGTALAELDASDDIVFSDRLLRFHLPIDNENEAESMVQAAVRAHARAKTIAEAIAILPMPHDLDRHRSAWETMAEDHQAFFVPSVPAIYGFRTGARIHGGEERSLAITFRTVWKAGTPHTHVALNMSGMPLPESALSELVATEPTDRLRPLRDVFPTAEVLGRERVVLHRPGFTENPRALLAGLEIFFHWALDSRGERRADAPYR